jgi:putative ABC transport system ATP-binding protein
MEEVLLKANNIYKSYDNKNDVLEGISFELCEGDFITIMGPSGAGKSTFLNCISTLDIPSKGKVYICDKNLVTMSSNEISDFRYSSLGFIFQNMNLLESMTIFDNIAVPLILADTDNQMIEEKVIEISNKLGLTHLLNKYPSMCSGGEIQRVAIARAIINNPKIIIADEPTGNLDTVNSKNIMEILYNLNLNGVSIILVTHDNVVASFSKKVLYLKDGKIISCIERNNKSQKEYLDCINELTSQDNLLSVL